MRDHVTTINTPMSDLRLSLVFIGSIFHKKYGLKKQPEVVTKTGCGCNRA